MRNSFMDNIKNRKNSFIKKLWPQSLYGRLAAVWLAAMIIGHALQNVYGYMAIYDDQIARNDYYLAKDLAILLPQLEGASTAVRQSWVKQMERQGYSYELGNILVKQQSGLNPKKRAPNVLMHIYNELGNTYVPTLLEAQGLEEDFRLRIQLHDGTPLTIKVNKTIWPRDWGAGFVFFMQVVAVVTFTWLAVRQATKSLSRLAQAAEKLGTDLDCQPIPEDGPSEVARAAVAFNRMQTQIKDHLAERVQILASISHDLQTPITRMLLRTELIETEEQQHKWQGDLNAMQVLVEEGITYARSAQRTTEIVCRVDIDALLDSLVCDYVDAGEQVGISGEVGKIISTRPNALKRIITNLLDNALKFATDVELQISKPSPTSLAIKVLDRGPGIPDGELAAVLQPFYRVENSRNRHTGGTGLGLAIAQQLSHSLQGTITLKNRDGGGLEASLVFPIICENKV